MLESQVCQNWKWDNPNCPLVFPAPVLVEGRKPAALSTARAARPVGVRRGAEKIPAPAVLGFQAEGWNWGRHGQSLPTALCSGHLSAPELFMISAPVSLDTPKASPCSAHQGSSPGDGQRRVVRGRAPSKQLPGILPLCHPPSSPPWMVRGWPWPSLLPWHPLPQPSSQEHQAQ